MKTVPLNVACKLALLVVLPAFVGCPAAAGPARYELSGSVTYAGKPVPVGQITFIPDDSQGNQGPGTTANIRDGRYQTEAGQGTIGGPHSVSIIGFDGKPTNPNDAWGLPLFREFKANANLPREPATQDFIVPVQPKGVAPPRPKAAT